jgi:hypothetical protein
LALVELSVVEQRYRAVLEAAAGVPVTEVAARYECHARACTPGSSATGRAGWAPWQTGHAGLIPARTRSAHRSRRRCVRCAPTATRTRDLLLRRQSLYPLSYRGPVASLPAG